VIRAMAVASASCEEPVAGAVDLNRAAQLEAAMSAEAVEPSRVESLASWRT